MTFLILKSWVEDFKWDIDDDKLIQKDSIIILTSLFQPINTISQHKNISRKSGPIWKN